MTKLSGFKNTLLITTTLTAAALGYGRRAYAFVPPPPPGSYTGTCATTFYANSFSPFTQNGSFVNISSSYCNLSVATVAGSLSDASYITDGGGNASYPGTAVTVSGDGAILFSDTHNSTFHGSDTGLFINLISPTSGPTSNSISLYSSASYGLTTYTASDSLFLSVGFPSASSSTTSASTPAFSHYGHIYALGGNTPVTGSLTLSANGDLTGDDGFGLKVINDGATGGITISLTGDTISGGTAGIFIYNNSGSGGAVTLSASGNIYSKYGTGVAVVNDGSNSVSISLTGDVESHGDGDGVVVSNAGTYTNIAAQKVTTNGNGFLVSGGTGNTSINANDAVDAGSNGFSISNGDGIDTNITSQKVNSGSNAFLVSGGSGNTSINAKDTVTADSNGFLISNGDGIDTNITSQKVNSGSNAFLVSGGSGNTSINTKDTVTAVSNGFLISNGDGIDTNITSQKVNSGSNAFLISGGSGNTSITAKDTVTADSNGFLISDGDGIDTDITTQKVDSGSNAFLITGGSGNTSINTKDTVTAGSNAFLITGGSGNTSINTKDTVTADSNGFLISDSAGIDTNITTQKVDSGSNAFLITGGSGNTSINTKDTVTAVSNAFLIGDSAGIDTNITTQKVDAGTNAFLITGGSGNTSINAKNTVTAGTNAFLITGGSGNTSINAKNTVTAGTNAFLISDSSGVDTNITAQKVNSGTNAFLITGGSGNTSINANGAVDAGTNAFLISDSSGVNTNITTQDVTAGSDGFSITGGSGTTSVSTGNVSAAGNAILVSSTGTDITIAAKAGSTISGDSGFGISVDNAGTGATTITNLNNSEISGSTAGVSVTGGATASGFLSNAKGASITGDTGIIVAGNGLAGVSGGISNYGTIHGTDGNAISFVGLTGETHLTLYDGDVFGDVVDDAVSNGYSQVTVAGDISAAGNFNVGDFNVSEGATFTLGDGFTVASYNTVDIDGIFSVQSDPTIAGDVNIHAKGLLDIMADTTITKDLQNNGTLSIATGTLLEADTMSKGAGGIISFGVTSKSDHGQLTLDSGPGYLTSQTITIDLAKVNGITLSTAVLLIDGNGTLIGGPGKAGAPVTDNSPLWVFKIVDGSATHADFHSGAGDSDLYLVVDRTATLDNLHDSIDDTPNNEHAADVLVDLPDDSGPELDEIVSNLVNNPEDSHNTLESVQPAEDGGSVVGTLTFVDNSINLVTERLDALAGDGTDMTGLSGGESSSLSGRRVWSQASGQIAKQGFRDNISGFDSSLMAATVGMDTENLFDSGILGLAFSYGNTHIDSLNANRTDTDIDSYQATLYSDYDFGHDYYVNGILSGAYNSHATVRHDVGAIPGLTAYGDFNSWQAAARAEAGRSFYVGSGIFTPMALVNWVYYKAEGYTETGAGGASLNVGTQALNQVALGLGLKLGENLVYDDGTRIVPEVHTSYRRELIGDRLETSSSFIGGGAAFSGESPVPAQDKFNVGAQVKYLGIDNIELTASYDFDVKQDFTSHAGFLRAGYKF